MIHLALLVLSAIVLAFASVYAFLIALAITAAPFLLVGLVVWGALILFSRLADKLADN